MVLAHLNDRKANPGEAVKVGAESAMHFNLDGPGWVCYRSDKLEFVVLTNPELSILFLCCSS